MKNIKGSDGNGNWFNISSNGAVSFKMATEKRIRRMGYIETRAEEPKRVWHKSEDEKQVHRKTNSWSIPYWIMEHVDGIAFKTKKTTYFITKKDAMRNGQFLYFQQTGYEKKLYIGLEHWRTK